MKVVNSATSWTLLLCVCFMSMAGAGESVAVDSSNPCDSPTSMPPPAYAMPTYDPSQIKAMLTTPQNVDQLLSNLKVVLHRNLLVQPAFFQEGVLLSAFNGTAIHWPQPGTADLVGDWVVKPTQRAQVIVRTDAFPKMKVDVGWNHRCLNRRPDPRKAGTDIAPATYDSGYIRLRFEPLEGFTVGAVRRVFGDAWWAFGPSCTQPLPLSYAGPGAATDAFNLDEANFYPDATAYEQLCRSKTQSRLPDAVPITAVWLRVAEQDYTHQEPPVY